MFGMDEWKERDMWYVKFGGWECISMANYRACVPIGRGDLVGIQALQDHWMG